MVIELNWVDMLITIIVSNRDYNRKKVKREEKKENNMTEKQILKEMERITTDIKTGINNPFFKVNKDGVVLELEELIKKIKGESK